MVQNAFTSFDGFTKDERQKVRYGNAFKLFPGLKEKFPELG